MQQDERNATPDSAVPGEQCLQLHLESGPEDSATRKQETRAQAVPGGGIVRRMDLYPTPARNLQELGTGGLTGGCIRTRGPVGLSGVQWALTTKKSQLSEVQRASARLRALIWEHEAPGSNPGIPTTNTHVRRLTGQKLRGVHAVMLTVVLAGLVVLGTGLGIQRRAVGKAPGGG